MEHQGGGSGAGNTSASAEAIGFITEFNQNALIFNEQIAPLLEANAQAAEANQIMASNVRDKADTAYNNSLHAMGEINMLKVRVARLDGANGADNPAFRNSDRTTADGTGFTE